MGEAQPTMRPVHLHNLTSMLNELAMHDRTAPSFHHIDGALAIRPNMKDLISKDSQEIHENDCGPTSRESLAGPRLRLNRRSVRVDMELENDRAITRNLKRSKVIFQTFRALKKSIKSCGCLMPKKQPKIANCTRGRALTQLHVPGGVPFALQKDTAFAVPLGDCDTCRPPSAEGRSSNARTCPRVLESKKVSVPHLSNWMGVAGACCKNFADKMPATSCCNCARIPVSAATCSLKPGVTCSWL